MNRSREIVTIMSKISSNCEKKEATACCSKLLDIFSMYPDIKEHLVTHFGATPILEMFEATQSCPQTVCEGRTDGLQLRVYLNMPSYLACFLRCTSLLMSQYLPHFPRDSLIVYSPLMQLMSHLEIRSTRSSSCKYCPASVPPYPLKMGCFLLS